MPLRILAMEVSQRTGGLALRCADGRVLVDPLETSTRRGDALMPAVEHLLRQAGMCPSDLEALGISIGPGGFTGLRIGLAVAKVLSWSLKIPVAAVPTALVAAESDSGDWARAAVALAGKDDSCWLSIVEGAPGDRRLGAGPEGGRLVDSAGFAAAVSAVDVILADDYLPSVMVTDRPVRTLNFDPRSLLLVTDRFLAEGRTIDPATLAPIYPRDPEAVRLWDARRSEA